jgi:hypothetical protein
VLAGLGIANARRGCGTPSKIHLQDRIHQWMNNILILALRPGHIDVVVDVVLFLLANFTYLLRLLPTLRSHRCQNALREKSRLTRGYISILPHVLLSCTAYRCTQLTTLASPCSILELIVLVSYPCPWQLTLVN